LREAASIIAHANGYRRLVGLRGTGQQQETEQDPSAHDEAGTLTQRHARLIETEI
jgi:hypothetical protein